jgi:hypothetical protein
MKEILPHFYKRIWGRLRKSDLRPLAVLLASSGNQVKVSSDKYDFDSVDELLSSEEPMAQIYFRVVFNPPENLSVHLNAGGALIHSMAADTFTLGLISKLEKFLRPRLGRWNPLDLSAAWIGAITLAAAFLVFSLVNTLLGTFWGVATIFIVLTTGIMLFFHRAFRLAGIFNSGIPITFRRERGVPFNWRGIGWELGKIAITAFVSVFLALLVQRHFTVSPSSSPPTTVAAPSSRLDSGVRP